MAFYLKGKNKKMNTLTDLKRYLATPNAVITMTGYELPAGDGWRALTPHNTKPRTVAKVQTNAVALFDDNTESGKCWLDFGKAAEWSFDGNTAIKTSDYCRLTYRIGN